MSNNANPDQAAMQEMSRRQQSQQQPQQLPQIQPVRIF